MRVVGRAEISRLHAHIRKEIDVYLGHGHAGGFLLLGQHHAVFANHAKAGINIVGTGFALVGGGGDKSRDKASGLILYGKLRFAAGGGCHGEGGHLSHHGGAGQRVTHGGRHYGVGISAQLHGHGKIPHGVAGKQHLGGKAYVVSTGKKYLPGGAVGLCKAGAVHIFTGHKAYKIAVIYGGGAAEKPGAVQIGQTHKEKHIHAGGSVHDLQKSFFRALQQSALGVQRAAGAARQHKLREHQHLHALITGGSGAFNDPVSVVVGIGHPDHGGCGRCFDKSVFHFV